jgi:hypothetical protein
VECLCGLSYPKGLMPFHWKRELVRRFSVASNILRSRDSSVGIATRYGLEGSGIEFRWGEIFRTYPDRLRGPPSLLYNGYRVFPGGKDGQGVMLTTQPLLVPRLIKSWAISPLTLWVLLGLLRGSLVTYLGPYEKCPILLPDSNQIWFYRLILIEVPNIKFHLSLSYWSRTDTLDRQADRWKDGSTDSLITYQLKRALIRLNPFTPNDIYVVPQR